MNFDEENEINGFWKSDGTEKIIVERTNAMLLTQVRLCTMIQKIMNKTMSTIVSQIKKNMKLHNSTYDTSSLNAAQKIHT